MVGKSFDQELVVINARGKHQFKAYPEKIIYFKSEDNYVKIVYLDKNKCLKSDLIRLTLVSVENQLKSYSQFTRIHRSYIVNLKFLKNNAVRDFVEVVVGSDFLQLPVSRKYKKALVEMIPKVNSHK
ncbi:LytTR family DNA-binding domain-containing protein [uncultured Croceitalea sp.]|uniref:LytR/AlgR family response regulator transcription factor n=1 Tax=uncultured Croceitalea sp. TaxID=1798908 RepID=UPI00330680E2